MAKAVRGSLKKKVLLKLELEPPSVSIAVASVSTLISFAIANVAFFRRAEEFAQWRQVRTEFAFSPPTHNLLHVAIFFVVGAIAVRERQWVAPFGIGLILCYMTMVGYVYSGPGYLINAVQPLLNFEMEMTGLGFLVNALMVIVWICVSKRSAKPLASEASPI